jgi:hypothetical protein
VPEELSSLKGSLLVVWRLADGVICKRIPVTRTSVSCAILNIECQTNLLVNTSESHETPNNLTPQVR